MRSSWSVVTRATLCALAVVAVSCAMGEEIDEPAAVPAASGGSGGAAGAGGEGGTAGDASSTAGQSGSGGESGGNGGSPDAASDADDSGAAGAALDGSTDSGNGGAAQDAGADSSDASGNGGAAQDASVDSGDASTDSGDASMADTGIQDAPADTLADAPVESGPDASDPCQLSLANYHYGFASAQGWTHQKMDNVTTSWTLDSWQNGAASSGPGSCYDGAGCWATNLSGNYIQCQRAELRSPAMDLSQCVDQDIKLSFWHWYDFWAGSYASQTWYDGGIIEISSNGGTTWTSPPGVAFPGTVRINPNMGSSYSCLSANSFYVHNRPGYTSESGSWQLVEFTIPQAFRTSSFRFRFAYASGVSYQTTSESTSKLYTRPGWYVDEVSILVP